MEPKFEPTHESIERDIAELSRAVGRESVKTPEAQREAVRQAIGERIAATGAPPPAGQPQPAKPAQPVSPALPDYMQDDPAALKLEVEGLVDFAFHKGIVKAVEQAKKDSPYLLDAFHDALTDKLYNELKRRGIIK